MMQFQGEETKYRNRNKIKTLYHSSHIIHQAISNTRSKDRIIVPMRHPNNLRIVPCRNKYQIAYKSMDKDIDKDNNS